MATWLWLGWRSPTRTETKVDKVIWRNGFLKQFQVQTLPNTSWCNWRSLVGFRLRCFTFSLWYMRLRKMEAAGRRVWCPMHWCLFNSCADKITDNTSSRAAKCSIRKSSWSENFRRNAFEVLRSETWFVQQLSQSGFKPQAVCVFFKTIQDKSRPSDWYYCPTLILTTLMTSQRASQQVNWVVLIFCSYKSSFVKKSED